VDVAAEQEVEVGVVVERVVGEGPATSAHLRRSKATVPRWETKWLEMYFRSAISFDDVRGSSLSKAPVPATSSVT